jgi:hypothetical protein
MFISDDGVDVYIQCIQRKAVFGKRKLTGCFTAINFDSCLSHSDPEETFAVSVALRQVSERNGRTGRGLTER